MNNWSERKLLVIDDDLLVRRELHRDLYGVGFDVVEIGCEEQAIELCRIVHFDAVLLAINKPGKSGIATGNEIRRLLPGVAILLLSGDDDEQRVVEALEAGFDDYITKPFRIRELTARLLAALRRASATAARSEEIIVIGEVSLDPARRLVRKGRFPIHLTPKEFDFLHYLMVHPGIPISHTRLLHAVWGEEYTSEIDYLRTMARQLRRKLEDDAHVPRYLLTHPYFGYRFADPSDWDRNETSSFAQVRDDPLKESSRRSEVP